MSARPDRKELKDGRPVLVVTAARPFFGRWTGKAWQSLFHGHEVRDRAAVDLVPVSPFLARVLAEAKPAAAEGAAP
jgi:hypothetical protein